MKKTILILLVAVLLIGGAYYYINEKVLTDELVLARAIQNTAQADSYTAQIDFELIAEERQEDFAGLSFSAVTDIDYLNEAAEGDIDFTMDYQMEGMDMKVSLDGGFIIADDNLYGRLDSIPAPLLIFLPPQEEEMISGFIGKWILLREGLEEAVEEEMDEEKLAELQAELEKLALGIWEKEVFSVKEKELDEINGKRVHKYSVTVDPENMASFYEEDLVPFFNLLDEEIPELSEEEMQEITKTVEKALEDVQLYFWADRNYVYRVRMESEMKMEEDDGPAEVKSLLMVFELNFSNFNQKFEINAPEEYLLMEDIMKSFEEMMMPSIPTEEQYQFDEEMLQDLEEFEGELIW